MKAKILSAVIAAALLAGCVTTRPPMPPAVIDHDAIRAMAEE